MKAIKRHYHWVILAILFSEMIIFGGIGNSIGVFTIPTVEELGISRGAYSLTASIKSLVGAVSTVLAASMFRRIGYQKSALISLVICGVSYVLRSVSESFALLLFSQALAGISIGALDTAGAVKTVDSWFHKHKGLILGFVSMATGLGGSIMSILLSKIITLRGWRIAGFAVAGFYLLLVVLYLFVRNGPEDMGLEPYGERETPKKKEKRHPSHENWHGRSAKELFRKPGFYLMAACTFMTIFCAKLSSSTVIPHFQDVGYSAGQAAMFNSVLMLCLAFAKLGCGELCDLIGSKKVAIICMVCLVVGQALMGVASNLLMAYASMVLLSVGLVMWTIMVPLLTRPLFGYAPSDTLIGIFLSMVSLSGMLSEPLVNYLYDALGSYSPVYLSAAVADVVLIGLYLVLFKLCDKDKKKYFEEESKGDEKSAS